MTDREKLTLKLLQEKLTVAKIGILAKGLQGIVPTTIVKELAKSCGKSIYAAIVGYEALSSVSDSLTISTAIEDAVLWRSMPACAGKIVVFVNGDTEKLHSLSELDLVTMRELTIALINEEKETQTNVPTKRFWDALIAQSSYYKFESVEKFIQQIHAVSSSSQAIPSSMWCLNLLRDDAILDSKSNPEVSLAENRKLIADAGQLSAEAIKRLSSWLVHAKESEKVELYTKYNLLQKYIELGDNQYIRDLDFPTVKKFLSVSKKPETTPPQPDDPPVDPVDPPIHPHAYKTKEIDSDLIESLFINDQEKISGAKSVFAKVEESLKAAKDEKETIVTIEEGSYDGQDVEVPNNETPLRKLVGRVCHSAAWGGILTTNESSLKDAISSLENEFHAIDPCINDSVTSFDSIALFEFLRSVDNDHLDDCIPFTPIIEKLIESRNKMLEHIDAIMYVPILAFGSDENLRNELFNYVDLWSELYSAVKNNYSAIYAKSNEGGVHISKATVLLDTLFIQTPSEWKAILLPLHPLFLWRYYEIFKTVINPARKKLSQEDIEDIKETISKLPQVVNVIIASDRITGGENKTLPNSGSIESLPTFENKVNRYIGSDGVQQFSDVLERWVGFAPFTSHEIRICAVDVPDFLAFLRAIKTFMSKPNVCQRIVIDAFTTRKQNYNNELSKLDYDGYDFQIGEFIKSGQLSITFHKVDGATEIKKELEKKPVHIAVYFDQSKYTVKYGPSHKSLYVTPLVVTYSYNYDSLRHRGTIAPSSDSTSGIIGDYHRVLENADIVKTDMNAQMTYNETEEISDIITTLKDGLTQWLVIADRTTEGFEPPESIPIGEKQTEKRIINTWASSNSRVISQYISMLCNYNLFPQRDRLNEILRSFGHIASNGLISIPKFGADNKAVENEKKGLLGTLFAAVKYTQDNKEQLPLVASLDTENARRWLRNSNFGNERADLIGMRYDEKSNVIYVDAIEVKTRENNSDIRINPDGTIEKHAAEQIANSIGKLREIFGQSEEQSEDMFVTARREVLKYQIISECFRKTQSIESKDKWASIFNKIFVAQPTIEIIISGIIYHFDLNKNSGGSIQDCEYTGDPHCKIRVYTLTTKEIQKEIFDQDSETKTSVPSSDYDSIPDEIDGYEDSSYALDTIDDPLSDDTDNAIDFNDIVILPPRNSEHQPSSDTTDPVEPEDIPVQTTNIPQSSEHASFGSDTRFLLGIDLHTQEKYYWEFGNKNLNNRHLLINGNSGCGKTYCIQGLLLEAVAHGVSAVIFDYTGGFTNNQLDSVFKEKIQNKITQRFVKVKKIPINPFIKHDMEIDEGVVIPEDNVDIANKIAAVFAKIYSLGDQQRSAVYTAVVNGLQKYGDAMSFHAMALELEEIGTTYAKTVLSKIQAFTDMNPFVPDENMDWSSIRDSGGSIYIFQMSGFEREIQVLLTELLLWDIWSFSMKNGSEDKPFIVVMDEAQNLNHGEKSASAKILTEGRKFGLSGWYATQFMKPQLSDDEIQRLQQAGQKLYFCPPDDGVNTVAKNIDISTLGAKEWAERLKKLKKGECVTCGNMLRNGRWTRYNPRVIKVPLIADREI